MTKYQVTYACSCEEGECTVTVKKDDGINKPPEVCVFGKNVAHVLDNGYPKWALKIERFKNDREGT